MLLRRADVKKAIVILVFSLIGLIAGLAGIVLSLIALFGVV